MNQPRPPNSRAILRAAFRTLSSHPRLLWFPVLTIVGIGLALGLGGVLAWLSFEVAADPRIELGWWSMLADPPPEGGAMARRGMLAGGLLSAVVFQLWSLLTAVGLSNATMEAMAGRPWSCRESFRHATRRLAAIATVAVAQAGVGRLLGRRKDPKKKRSFIERFTTRALEMAWWAATYLVVPVLAREKRGGIGSILRSAKLFRKTWKEAFIGRLALGWVWLGFVLLAVAPIAACIALGVSDGRALFVALVAPGAIALVGAIVVRTLDMIYRTALYVFATEGVVPEPFDQDELHAIFTVT